MLNGTQIRGAYSITAPRAPFRGHAIGAFRSGIFCLPVWYMGKTDIQIDAPPEGWKSSRWGFTAYEGQWHLFTGVLNPLIAEIGWQTEICPDTQREHYQGYVRFIRQLRFKQVKDIYPGVHLGVARNWQALVNYCKKKESAIPGTQVHTVVNAVPMMSMPEALTYLASFCPHELAHCPDFYEINPSKAEALMDKWQERRFWVMVDQAIKIDRNLITVYHQPQYIRAIKNTFSTWIEDACLHVEYSDHPDRQTDNDLPNNAFEN